MNNKALLNKLNDLTKVLNKLKQKYGKRKLIQYLNDLDPHLSRPQKKINKIYIRYTRFGTPGSALPRFRKRMKTFDPQAGTAARQLDLTPSAEPAAEPAEEPRIKINGKEALFFLCATQYYLFKKELSEAIFFSLQYGNDIPYEKIFKKYQDVICLLGNIKNVNLTRDSPDNKSSFGSRSGVKRQRDTSASTSTPLIKLTEIQKYLRGGWLKDTDKINWRNNLKENYRDWLSTSGQTIAWKHTQRQQNAIDNPQKNLTYRCSLCGCYMFHFTNRKHSPCGHSVELEHQIPGSRAVDMYFDVWETFSTLYPSLDLEQSTTEWLYQYEKAFFENIGDKSEIDNIVVYCCTLCNQMKSDMYPYEATDNNKVNLRTDCFNLFMERLKIIFTKTVSLTEPHDEWGPVTLKKCDLTYKLQCHIIWTVQFIYTFMMNTQEKRDHTNKTFGGSFMELLPFINNYQQKAIAAGKSFQNVNITSQNIWDIYYNGNFRGQKYSIDKYFGRPVDNNGQTITGQRAFQSLEDKYTSILGTLTNRLRTKFQDDNVTLSENEINLVRSIVDKIFRVRK